MQNYLIEFRSVTRAQSALQILRSKRIMASLSNIPSSDKAGCKYGISISKSDINKAVDILIANHIEFQSILRPAPDGATEVNAFDLSR